MSAGLIKKDIKEVKPIRMIAGRINVSSGTPSVVTGSGFTVSDTAAGKVTINFTRPGKACNSIVATPVQSTDATGYSCKIHGAPTGAAAIVSVYVADSTDGALADDVGFCFVALLQD